METFNKSCTRFVYLCLPAILVLCLSNRVTADNKVNSFDREEVARRVKALENIAVEPRYTRGVEGFIKGYTIRNRHIAERILGDQVIYFPIFEKYLREFDLPESLKYLAVIESALVPKAVSRAKAVGLWQFMDGTARHYGLKINKYIDERCDPIKSTKAAVEHLTDLHDKYRDWALAIAAYNSGSGRVSRAIKRARSKNFWRIRRYLPRETRNYVPAFIAACYLFDNYEFHELEPKYPELDLQITEITQVYDSFTFYQIAQLTELPLEIIENLNPAYVRGFIPSNQRGNFLILPKRAMPPVIDFLTSRRPDNRSNVLSASPVLVSRPALDNNSNFYFRGVHTVKESGNILQFAKLFGCSVHQLMAWNNLKSRNLKKGQQIVIYLPKEITKLKRYMELLKVEHFNPIETLNLIEREKKTFERRPIYSLEQIQLPKIFEKKYIYYTARKKERLKKIAKRIKGISLDDLIELNSLSAKDVIRAGTKIKIKKL